MQMTPGLCDTDELIRLVKFHGKWFRVDFGEFIILQSNYTTAQFFSSQKKMMVISQYGGFVSFSNVPRRFRKCR